MTASALVAEAEAFAGAITGAYEWFLSAGRGQPTPHPTHVYASAWRVCDRRMVYEMTVPERQAPFPPEVLARFRRGDDRERDLVADLTRVGRECRPEFRVTAQQGKFDVRDRRGRQVITGRIDGFLHVVATRRDYPFEVKAWHPNVVDKLDTFADVFDNVWTRSGGYQILTYLYATGEPVGFLVLDRSGIPKLLPVVLEQHLDKVEAFLQKAERCVDAALAGQLPDYLQDNVAECLRCPFYGHTCNPPIGDLADVRVFNDQDLEVNIGRLLEIEAVGREYQGLDAKLKKQLRGVEVGFAGPYAITGKWGPYTRADVPEAIKKLYTVTDPKGTFRLEFSKPNPAAPDTVPPTITEQLQASLALVKEPSNVEA